MPIKYVRSTVYVKRVQKEFVKRNYINFSKLCRASVDNLMKKSEGLNLHLQPTDESLVEDSYG